MENKTNSNNISMDNQMIGQKRAIDNQHTQDTVNKREKLNEFAKQYELFDLFTFLNEQFTECPADIVFDYLSDIEHVISVLKYEKGRELCSWSQISNFLRQIYGLCGCQIAFFSPTEEISEIISYLAFQCSKSSPEKDEARQLVFSYESSKQILFTQRIMDSCHWTKPKLVSIQEAYHIMKTSLTLKLFIPMMMGNISHHVGKKVLQRLETLELRSCFSTGNFDNDVDLHFDNYDYPIFCQHISSCWGREIGKFLHKILHQ